MCRLTARSTRIGGCEHGCIYCFARPSHAYWGLSPGLDFETKITAKPDAARLLAAEIAKPSYKVAPIAFGTNTDPYQPIESKRDHARPVAGAAGLEPLTGLVTRGQTVLRDLPLLAEMAARRLVHVGVSITTPDADLARALEPRAPAPATRLRMIREMAAAVAFGSASRSPRHPRPDRGRAGAYHGRRAQVRGATHASSIPLRLPNEVAPLFRDWLDRHRPDAAKHVMSRVQAMRGGRDNDPRFGNRMRGEGIEAELLHKRFRLAKKRLGYAETTPPLDCSRFGPPPKAGDQLSLF